MGTMFKSEFQTGIMFNFAFNHYMARVVMRGPIVGMTLANPNTNTSKVYTTHVEIVVVS